MSEKKKHLPSIRFSAAEYLTFIAASREGGVETIYADEDIWLSQKMMAVLYDVNVRTISEHLQTIFKDHELTEESVLRKFRITATDREILQDAGKVTAEIAKAHAEIEFEKYRITQDRLYQSDFDKQVLPLEELSRKSQNEGGEHE